MKCLKCGREFDPNKRHPKQKYCSVKCRVKAYYERMSAERREVLSLQKKISATLGRWPTVAEARRLM